MKRLTLIAWIVGVIAHSAFAQNIGISTDGSTPQTGIMLDIKGTNPRSTAAIDTIFQIGSFNATANQLKMRMMLGGGGASARFGGLEVYDASASTYRDLALQPYGGKVGIGLSNPTRRLHVYSNDPTGFINTYSNYAPTLTADQAVNIHATWSEITTASTFKFNCTLYGAVNRVSLLAGQTGTVTATTGATNDVFHYGSGAIGIGTGSRNSITNTSTAIITDGYASYNDVWNTGGGSVTNGYGVYIGTIQSTNKWGLYSVDASAKSYFAGSVGIGTTTPGSALEVNGQVKITGGTPGTGKVLTSDAAGLASWGTGPTTSGSGNIVLLSNDETSSAALTSTTASVKNYTMLANYTQVKVEVEFEYDGNTACDWTLDILYNGVVKRTAVIVMPVSQKMSTSFSYMGAVSSGQVVQVNVTRNAGKNIYIRNFRVYGIY